MRRLSVILLVASLSCAVSYAQTQTPLTPIGELRGRADPDGYLLQTVADKFASGTITAGGQSVIIKIGGRGAVSATLTGTWNANVIAEMSGDETCATSPGTATWDQTDLFLRSVGTVQFAVGSNGFYTLSWGGGAVCARITTQSFTSGTINVAMVATGNPMVLAETSSQGDGGPIPANGKQIGLEAPNGSLQYIRGDNAGNLFVIPNHTTRWDCNLDNISTTLTECKAAPGASLSLYITGFTAGSTTSTAGQHMLRYGTGSNCGTGTTTLFPGTGTTPRVTSPANTAGPTVVMLGMPIKVPANNALCVLGVATNTTWIVISGFTAE